MQSFLRQNNNSFVDNRSGYQQFNRNFQKIYYDDAKKSEKNSSSEQHDGYQSVEYNEHLNDWQDSFNEDDDYYDNDNDDTKQQSSVENSHSFFVNTSITQARIYICRRYDIEFYSNNKLHKHIRTCKIKSTKKASAFIFIFTEVVDACQTIVIQFSVLSNNQSDVKFRIWRYVIFAAFINKSDSFNELCCDIECDYFLVDRSFLIAKISNYQQQIKQIIVMKIRDIDDALIETKKHISLNFRIFGKMKSKPAVICFIRHVYIVESLKTKILLNNDVFDSKQIVLNVDKKVVTINSCQNLVIKLNVINADSSVKRVVRVSFAIKISARFSVTVSFKLRDKDSFLSAERNFIFISKRIDRLNKNDDILSHIIDAITEVVLINNVSTEDVFLSKNCHIDTIQKYEKEDCFLAESKEASLVANFDSHKSASRNWFKKMTKTEVAVLAADAVAMSTY